ncbi:MAG: class II aldolase/adducin family protein [Desulfobacteraceae bacterium]|nr:class II aldolase/adducin family protein [Desulfobacteraceae bacterium]
MQQKIAPYETRLYKNGLAAPGTAVFGTFEKALEWNSSTPACEVLKPLFSAFKAGAILYAQTAEPYAAALNYLAQTCPDCVIRPRDSETRMFLHDLPVAEGFDTESLSRALKKRNCTIVKGRGVVACGRDAGEAYVNFSAACFSGFVKFFSDTLQASRTGDIGKPRAKAFSTACKHLPPPSVYEGGLKNGPFKTKDQAHKAIIEAGKEIVSRGLVNACFGNISYRIGNTLYITASGSFLDELEDEVLEANIKDGSCMNGKPSSELPAHLEIAASTDFRAVLHGHPLFSVIMSMDCRQGNCQHQGSCHLDCPVQREISAIPIVPGETGGGPYGLCNTVPPAVKKSKAAIVYGHGVFTCASEDFGNALGRMATIERICRKIYFERLDPSAAPAELGL